MPFERPIWPDGARCAVTLTFDNFGESLDLLRYGHAGGASADGVYAPRRGIARVLDLLERHRIPGTFFVEGWNARKYASLVREIADAGHEIGSCHPRFSGRPARILTLDQLVEHIERQDGVWFARCDDVATHVRPLATTPVYAAPEIAPK